MIHKPNKDISSPSNVRFVSLSYWEHFRSLTRHKDGSGFRRKKTTISSHVRKCIEDTQYNKSGNDDSYIFCNVFSCVPPRVCIHGSFANCITGLHYEQWSISPMEGPGNTLSAYPLHETIHFISYSTVHYSSSPRKQEKKTDGRRKCRPARNGPDAKFADHVRRKKESDISGMP